MTTAATPETVARLQAKFDHFARHAFADEPLYAALSAAAAAHADWAALLAGAPASQQLPLLWLAALQDRVLELVDAGERPPLADYFASAGDARAPDAALLAHLGDFLAAHRDALVRRIATRTTQTNEIGRCAVLWPILQDLAETTGRPIALLDVGCSAGLNLGVDRWRYRYVDDATGATFATTPADRDPAAPEIACRVLAGARPSATAEPVITSRCGIDVSPIFVDDAAEVRWLRACLWPHDRERATRLETAIEFAQLAKRRVQQSGDGLAVLTAWLDGLPHGVLVHHVHRERVGTHALNDPPRGVGWWTAMPIATHPRSVAQAEAKGAVVIAIAIDAQIEPRAAAEVEERQLVAAAVLGDRAQ